MKLEVDKYLGLYIARAGVFTEFIGGTIAVFFYNTSFGLFLFWLGLPFAIIGIAIHFTAQFND